MVQIIYYLVAELDFERQWVDIGTCLMYYYFSLGI